MVGGIAYAPWILKFYCFLGNSGISGNTNNIQVEAADEK